MGLLDKLLKKGPKASEVTKEAVRYTGMRKRNMRRGVRPRHTGNMQRKSAGILRPCFPTGRSLSIMN